MHQIQVACILHHGRHSKFFDAYLRRLVDEQLLLASATTEVGIGGDLRTSLCCVQASGQGFELEKKAPVISYALASDAILLTARRHPGADSSDQVQVLLEKGQYELEEMTVWDTLGFRGTCSAGFTLRGGGHLAQVLPASFSTVLAHTMHPYSHLSWGSLWLGMATDAVAKARSAVRAKLLDDPSTPPPSALRLAETDELLFQMRSVIHGTLAEYEELLSSDDDDARSQFGFSVRVNNVKVITSDLLVEIVRRALQIVGISGYETILRTACRVTCVMPWRCVDGEQRPYPWSQCHDAGGLQAALTHGSPGWQRRDFHSACILMSSGTLASCLSRLSSRTRSG